MKDTTPAIDKINEYIDVLDLPQIYQQPSAGQLLSILESLRLRPASWDAAPFGSEERRPRISGDGIPAYLTKIISSPLAWIEGDVVKEQIWDMASQRLSERSGRSGMGAITRTFKIPLHDDDVFELQLHEPALTADNLGLKTWASSYLLAKRLPALRSSLPSLSSQSNILELGSGTGLVGLAAAAIFKAHVVLTDLPEIVPNLRNNIEANATHLATFGGSAQAEVLDWSNPSAFESDSSSAPLPNSFPWILAADPIYSSDHPRLLGQTIEYHLSRHKDARFIVELPLREPYAAERKDLMQRLSALGLVILDEGEEVGYDDWMEGGQLAEVRCCWAVWGWK